MGCPSTAAPSSRPPSPKRPRRNCKTSCMASSRARHRPGTAERGAGWTATSARRCKKSSRPTAVHNLLAIALPSRDYGDDAALAQLVNEALAANRAVPDGVQATAREGDIFLTGTVSYSAQRSAAEDAVAGVAGVLSVTNQIEVQGGA